MWPSSTGTRAAWALITIGAGVTPSAPRIAQDLPRLDLDLLFLAVDERHDVAEQVPRRHARVPGARRRLERRHQDAPRRERPARREHEGQEDRRAVRIRHDRAGPPAAGLLGRQQGEVVRVHLGDDERHIVGQAVRARVADDDVAGLGEGVLVAGGGVGIEGREEQQGRARRESASRRAGRARRRAGSPRAASAGRRTASPQTARWRRARSGGTTGGFSSRRTRCCPTMPVAPSTPTSHPCVAMTPASPAPGAGAGR